MLANPGKNAVYGFQNRAYRQSRGGFRPTSASCIIKDEYGYEVSFVSVGNILKDIDWMKKEKRRMKRLETV